MPSIIKRNNVNIVGEGERTIMLAHGFGCDQTMWRFLLPYLERKFRIVLFDYVGCGKSDLNAYDKHRYAELKGYAEDVIEICDELELSELNFIGHSVSSIIGSYATIKAPQYFSKLVMVCPSPCFLNFPPDYLGGFERDDLVELLNLMDKNYIGWASYLAPLVMGINTPSELVGELENSFCSTDPTFVKPFANATFFADDRSLLPNIKIPTLILQSSDDNLASVSVGTYMHKHIPDAQLEILEAHGHCLHMTNPTDVANAILNFID